ncbi:hypothetical protein HYPBUDRAFT_152202 [Hyphopichia burtonii NRRL Y-1933]|uniref:Flavin reductase like domain-containing protein n=1 Tax=Hyphopichia burtonii NRRL Y-1933 TaxID=984485 RepID=A0A1E4RPD3_9ASCO|nr:hypothetical protein HYPBUDRAFT_152202 [Hyphopichia burtonii NRRL Y-1933]ODV68945.1 hypothetical protein HYPBUDRAFT_152202 [Hyphopichia burtonii NRRL Y-1933]
MSVHPDLKVVESQRPPFHDDEFKFTQTRKTDWTPGSGANDDQWKSHKKLEINPYEEGRSPIDNYKTTISGILPRPIGFISTVSKDGEHRNLAPFLFFNGVNVDPPIYTIGISGNTKDTAINILETKELTINIISEWFIEAANFTSIDAPKGIDEWKLSGLTPAESTFVKPSHVAESAFSIEAKLIHSHDWRSKTDPSKVTGQLFIVEGLNFHIREDVINKEKNVIDIKKLKPVTRLGGISYGRILEGFELPRPEYKKDILDHEEYRNLTK